MRAAWIAVCCLGMILGVGASPETAAEEIATPPLLLILDASGSMWGQVDGENKIVIARRSLGRLVDDLPETATVGLLAYGHRRKGDCSDIEVLAPVGPLDRSVLKDAVENLNPKGKTPLTAAVELAFGMIDETATVVLLSDGLETCDGDPCKAVRHARETEKDLVLHVVGFDVEGEDLSQLQCMAQAGGGLFLNAGSAEQLGSALDAAVALPVDAPVGRLALHATADGELQDVAVRIERKDDGEEAAVARTYTGPDTNPSSIPLADGVYQVYVKAVGLKGARERRFDVEIVDGATVEREVDYSTGELSIRVERNGALSDAVYKVYGTGTDKEVASGRTYTTAAQNPAKVRLTAGRYDVTVKSVEIAGKPSHSFATVEIGPDGTTALDHAFASGTLMIGALRGAERVDALVQVVDAESGAGIDQARTYTGEKSNPKSFELAPGRYRIEVKTLGKKQAKKQIEAVVEAGKTVTHDLDFAPKSAEP